MIDGVRSKVDLERAVAGIAARHERWADGGVVASHVLWWGEDGGYPEPDRSLVAEPASVSLRVEGASWAVYLVAELRRDGRAFLYWCTEADQVTESRRVRSGAAWGTLLDEAVARAPRIRLQYAQLVARTCTTGWRDWIHGELWLLPTALVRVRGGLLDTVLNSTGSGLTLRNPGRTVAYDPPAVLAAHRTNKVIPFDAIDRARIHGGLTTSGLTAEMADGTRHKLLWMASEPARRLLTDRLLPVLGPRLIR